MRPILYIFLTIILFGILILMNFALTSPGFVFPALRAFLGSWGSFMIFVAGLILTSLLIVGTIFIKKTPGFTLVFFYGRVSAFSDLQPARLRLPLLSFLHFL